MKGAGVPMRRNCQESRHGTYEGGFPRNFILARLVALCNSRVARNFDRHELSRQIDIVLPPRCLAAPAQGTVIRQVGRAYRMSAGKGRNRYSLSLLGLSQEQTACRVLVHLHGPQNTAYIRSQVLDDTGRTEAQAAGNR